MRHERSWKQVGMSKNQCDGNDDIHSPRLDVTISQVDRSLPLPRYATSGSVGFDLFCRVDTVIEPGEIGLRQEM